MSYKLLLPNKYKLIGWCLIIPSTILGVVLLLTEPYEAFSIEAKVFSIVEVGFFQSNQYFKFHQYNITPTLVGIAFIIGGMLLIFSKEKIEDEFISRLRFNSLLWAVLINYVIIILCFLFLFSLTFFYGIIFYMFSIIVVFIVKFNYVLYKGSKEMHSENYNRILMR